MSISIYHNPRCSKSRAALKLLEDRGLNPKIVEYLKYPPTIAELKSVLKKLKKRPFEIVRTGERLYKERYRGQVLSDDQWLQALHENPILLERPIVVSGALAVVGRPPEAVLTVL